MTGTEPIWNKSGVGESQFPSGGGCEYMLATGDDATHEDVATGKEAAGDGAPDPDEPDCSIWDSLVSTCPRGEPAGLCIVPVAAEPPMTGTEPIWNKSGVGESQFPSGGGCEYMLATGDDATHEDGATGREAAGNGAPDPDEPDCSIWDSLVSTCPRG
eukprot:TRINITY_DN3307_c0_g2_i2.p2 TRINITY_DN3307_c0_g2~~TRINITY_DN3307_c0_g2_i2.p2  ORF type:complete len:158 (+),score=14.72 TRINITY_DN3307_c0_g2_i2:117-590(+)